MGETDRDFIQRCLDGHPDDFRFLIGRYQRSVLAFLSGRLRHPALVEDAAQEAFVRAFFNLRMLKKPDAFFAWLLGIAQRVAQETIRQEQTERRYTGNHFSEPRNGEDSPLQEASTEALERAVAGLADPLKEVVLLRFFADFTCGQIADRLGLPIGTVTKRLSRAYAEIRERLAPDHLGK